MPETTHHALLSELVGRTEDLGPLPMALRALGMFVVVLALIRLGGSRIFGAKSALDSVVAIMLGAVAARGIVGASPFLSSVAACGVLVGVHYLLGWLESRSEWVGRIVSGVPVVLYENGRIVRRNLKKTVVSEGELLASARLETGSPTLDPIERAVMEPNGRISFVRKQPSGN